MSDSQWEYGTRFSFLEASVLWENIMRAPDQAGFIIVIDNLLNNTQDQRLVMVLEQLLRKVQSLTPNEFVQLQKDARENRILVPPNYLI